MAYGIVLLVDGERADDLMDINSVEIHERIGAPTHYSLRYSVENNEGELEPLIEPRFNPSRDLAIFQRAEEEDFNDCLVKGPIYSHQIELVSGTEGSILEVIGADSSLLMDRETKITQWADNTTDADAVTSIVSSYGLTPDVDSTNTRHLEDHRTLIQHDTDLDFVRILARRNGYLFWVSCDAELVETAHFKPPPLSGGTPPILTLTGENPTMNTLSIEWDVERPTSVIAYGLDHRSKTIMDGTGVPPPASFPEDMPLHEIVTETRSTSLIVAATDTGDLISRASGTLMDSSWFLHASCTVSARDLGQIIHAHSVVELQGIGSRYSGLYFVRRVHHMIDESDHYMSLSLVRNGWGRGGDGGLLGGLL